MTFRNDAGLAFLIDDETGRVCQHQHILALEELLDLLVALTAVSLSAAAFYQLNVKLPSLHSIIVPEDEQVFRIGAE